MKRSHRVFIASAAALLAFYFAWEWYLSPQAGVERFLHRVAEAAEDKDRDRLLSSFAREYSDFRGLDYDSVAALIDRALAEVDRLNVTLEAVRPEVDGDQSSASFDLTVVAVRGNERHLVVGQPMQGEKLHVRLRKESGDWKILSVARTEAEY